MTNLLMDFFRFVFYCCLFYTAFIICKAIFDVVVVAVQYYCFGKKPTPASRNTEKDKSPQDDIHYIFWDD
jgi:hypothetical protein